LATIGAVSARRTYDATAKPSAVNDTPPTTRVTNAAGRSSTRMWTPKAGTATTNMSTTAASAASTVDATQEPRNTDIGSGVPRTRLNAPCSRAVATPKMTKLYVAAVSAKIAIDGVMYCAYRTRPPGTGTVPLPSEPRRTSRTSGKTNVKKVARGVRNISRRRAVIQSRPSARSGRPLTSLAPR
jgi:hypothetical protein